MDRRERIENPQVALLTAMQGWQTTIWTALPGIIESFNPAQMTVTVQPVIQAKNTNFETNETNWDTLPLLLDVPIVIQNAGGYSITIPVTKGDECLVCFSARCIDAWWQSGGIQQQSELRMHDLSDGFAFIGPKSLPNVIANYSTTSAQIRSNDGSLVIDLNTASNAVSITAPTIKVNGNLAVTGNITSTGNMTATGNVHSNATGHTL